MTTTESQPAETKKKSPWFRFAWLKFFIITLLLLAFVICLIISIFGLPLAWTADYDKERYTQIRRAIDADPQHLLGKSLDEVTKEFNLEEVPWDDAAVQQESGMFRIYHFRGFALYITLTRLPVGITPDSKRSWTASGLDLQHHGVLWLANQYPSVHIDGISDGKERMKLYWEAIDQECERINAEMKKSREEKKRRNNSR